MVDYPNDPNYAPVIPDRKAPLTPDMGSIYYPQPGASLTLYEDIKAHHVGDLITVRLSEVTTAQKNANNNYTRNSSVGMNSPNILGTTAKWKFPKMLPVPLQTTQNLTFDATLGSNSQLVGTAQGLQNNTLQGTISVVVTQILPNGNLYVRGEKWININDGDEFVRISGIIRPEDISAQNVVNSDRIADARIAYSGKGAFANQSKVGWLTRFFTSPFWPI